MARLDLLAAGGGQPAMESYARYTDLPTDWRTRLVGMSGTAGVFMLVAVVAAVLAWRAVAPMLAAPAPIMVTLHPPAAPPEPVEEVPEGAKQVEQQRQEEQPQPPEVPPPPQPSPLTVPMPVAAPVKAAESVPETTAPRSIAAPPAQQASSDAEATWEAELLAHLERFRRYPPAARARRAQGVAHVRFRMNRAGTLLSAEILRSSGAAVLDRAALETLRRAQPLPPIPDDRPDELELTVPVEFFVK